MAAVAGGVRLNEVKSGAWLYLVAQSDDVRRRASMEAACRFEVVWAAGPTEAAAQGWADAARAEGVERHRRPKGDGEEFDLLWPEGLAPDGVTRVTRVTCYTRCGSLC